MATLRELYDTDFNRVMKLAHRTQSTVRTAAGLRELPVAVHLDFDANAKFVSCYLSADASTEAVCHSLVTQIDELVNIGNDAVRIMAGRQGDTNPIRSEELRFAGRLFIYHEVDLAEDVIARLLERAAASNVAIQLRGPRYAAERTALERPLAFISHDSRDKDEVARPLAIQLMRLQCPVWFDEFTLQVGARLRESIERGLREANKCVLLLTPNFLANTGWTRVEFNAVFTRELVERQDVVLPVWAGVTREEVYAYSPTLADRFAANWALGAEEVARRLRRAIVQ